MATAYARWLHATRSRSTVKMQWFETPIHLEFDLGTYLGTSCGLARPLGTSFGTSCGLVWGSLVASFRTSSLSSLLSSLFFLLSSLFSLLSSLFSLLSLLFALLSCLFPPWGRNFSGPLDFHLCSWCYYFCCCLFSAAAAAAVAAAAFFACIDAADLRRP